MHWPKAGYALFHLTHEPDMPILRIMHRVKNDGAMGLL